MNESIEQKMAGIPWRCEKCGSTIAITHEGSCMMQGNTKVWLGKDYTQVECPVCGHVNSWFCNYTCKTS